MMGDELKETRHATAAQAEISEVPPGETAQPPRHQDAARYRLSTLQESSTGPSRVPDLRHLPGPGSDHAPDSRPGRLAPAISAVTAFIAFEDPSRRDCAFVFP